MLLLTTDSYNGIIMQAIEKYPFECCGFLLGKEDGEQHIVSRIIVCENKAARKEKEFFMSPEDFMSVEKTADAKGLDLIGIYHSHPDSDAIPSETDVMNALPNLSYLIISVYKHKVSLARSWRLSDRQLFEEETIITNQNTLAKIIRLMATIIIPTPLRKFTGNSSKVSIAGNNVGQALQELTTKYPDLKKHLFDTEDKVRPFINIFVGEDDIRNLQQQDTAIADSSTISIVPAIAGGSFFFKNKQHELE